MNVRSNTTGNEQAVVEPPRAGVLRFLPVTACQDRLVGIARNYALVTLATALGIIAVAGATTGVGTTAALSLPAYLAAATLLILLLTAFIVVASKGNRRLPTDHRLSCPLVGLLAPFSRTDSPNEAALRLEQTAHVLDQLDVMMAINIVNAVLMVFAMHATSHPLVLYGWFAFVVGMALLGIKARVTASKRPPPKSVSKRTLRRVALHAGIRGVCWGLPFALFFTNTGTTGQLILLSVSAGMTAGGIPALAPIPAAAMLYGLGVMFPTLLKLVASGDVGHLMIAGFGLTYSASLAAVACQLYSTFATNLIIRRTQSEQAATISLLLNEFETSASDWLWATAKSGEFTRLPLRMVDVFDLKAGEGKRLGLADLMARVEEAERAQLARLLDGTEPFRDITLKTRDSTGTERWIALTASPDPTGGWRGVGSDITAKVMARNDVAKALDRAKRAEQRLKDGIDTLAAGFILTDSEDRTLIANQRFQQLLPAAGLLGAKPRFNDIAETQAGLWFAHNPDQKAAWLAGLLGTRDKASTPNDIELPDGKWLRVEGNATTEGGIVTVLTDITDIKQQEAKLEIQTRLLAQSNNELQQFATVASHDLQEPLRKIEAFSSRLQKRNAGKLDSESDMYIERMQSATQRMRLLITDLLSYSRVTRKGADFRMIDLNRIAAAVADDLSIAIEEKKARLDIHDLGGLSGDPTQLRQLVQNLISNALKFVKPDVAPVITIERRELPDGMVEIRFADNGIGFDMQHHDKIFEIFQRLHGRDQYEGTGIGLATCRKIVERHNGVLRAESRVGDGATFIATFPAAQKSGADEQAGGGKPEAADVAAKSAA